MTRLWFISHASKVMLKVLQARLQQYVNWELQMYKLVLENAKKPEIKLPTFFESEKKQGSSRKTPTSTSLTVRSLWLCASQQNLNFLKRWEYQTTLPVSWETYVWIKNQQLEPYMEQQNGSKLGKAVHCDRVYLTYRQSVHAW